MLLQAQSLRGFLAIAPLELGPADRRGGYAVRVH
jgi:hypothetical protein